jgi:hypothetical protein
MSTKLIAVLIIALVLWVGYRVVKYANEVKTQQAIEEKSKVVVPEQLTGMPWQLENSLRAAQKGGATALRQWLEQNNASLKDPRKAWIELDFCTLVARDNPQEAKRVFAAVKARTRSTSPVYPRIKELERTFE